MGYVLDEGFEEESDDSDGETYETHRHPTHALCHVAVWQCQCRSGKLSSPNQFLISVSVLVVFVREKFFVAAGSSMAACMTLILSLSTPPPVLGRLPQRRCGLRHRSFRSLYGHPHTKGPTDSVRILRVLPLGHEKPLPTKIMLGKW